MEKERHFIQNSMRKDWRASICYSNTARLLQGVSFVFMPHLADIERVVVEAFDKEQHSRWWELVVIPQQQ